MILAIDIGNTNITFGCIEDGHIQLVFTMSTGISRTADEYVVGIKSILDFNEVDCTQIEGTIITSVVPPLTREIQNATQQLTGKEALLIGAGIKTGMNIRIDDPAQLGGDMVAAAVGALAAYGLPAIIIDMGTATKMCVLDKDGSFIGGAIAPGIALSTNALSMGTSQLPHVLIEAPANAISTNTVDCMKSGTVFGTAAMIDGMIARFETELKQRANSIIITGGLAELVHSHCTREITHDPHLLLTGLEIIYKKNRPNAS